MKTQGSNTDVMFLSGVRTGFEAITQGAQLIMLGEAQAVLAGGTESMSQAPHVVRGARWGLRLGPAPLEDLLWEALKDPQCGLSMAETAESLAEKYKLTRKDVDEVAVELVLLGEPLRGLGH